MKGLLLVAALALASPAVGHDQWADGTPVPDWVKQACCGKSEVHMLTPDQVHHNVAEEYYYFERSYKGKVTDAQVLPSQDGHYWLFYACAEPTCAVHCFFVPLAF